MAPVAAVYECRIDFFQLLAKSLTAKSWGEEPQPDGVVVVRITAGGGKSDRICMVESKSKPSAHRDAATAPQKNDFAVNDFVKISGAHRDAATGQASPL